MDFNFRFKDYNTQYFSGSVCIRDVCFACGFFRGIYGNDTFVTYIIPKRVSKLSYCFLTKDELITYITELSTLLGFSVISIADKRAKYLVQVKLVNDSRYCLYVSTLIRYTYEFPYSILLKGAVKDKEVFTKFNIIHIIQLYLALFASGWAGHQLAGYGDTFYNINSKSQFNLIRNYFNSSKSFYLIDSHKISFGKYYTFNEEDIPMIISMINNTILSFYKKYEKYLCCRS